MFVRNKLVSDIPREPIKANVDILDDSLIIFDEDNDFNLKVSHVYEFESDIHGGQIKKMIINGLHSGISDQSLGYVAVLYAYLTAVPCVDLYETRKLLFYDKN